jgi:polysaccharide export outer membrane protein
VAKPYRLQITTLSINIKAIDPTVLQMREILLNQQLDCIFLMFTVDDHGNIRMPVLGELNCFTLDEIRVKIEKQLLADYFKKEANIFCHCKISGALSIH